MLINVKGKHVEITDALREHAEEKVNKLPRYYNSLNQVDVLVDGRDGGHQSVEVIARAEHNRIFVGKEEGNDTYTCIDMAVHKVESQLRKHKEKERNTKHKVVDRQDLNQ